MDWLRAMQFDRIAGEDCGGELCPSARAIVDELRDPKAPPAEQTDIQAARVGHVLAAYDLSLRSTQLQSEERSLDTNGSHNLRVRIYTPDGKGPFPILVFAHGGCWTFCGLDSHDRICRYYADEAPCIVVSVDYALAPEQPFPEGVNDFYNAVVWCYENAESIKGDPSRIAVAGDSAGGNLSAVVAQRLQSHAKIKLSLQILIYPICDLSDFHSRSMQRYANGYFLTLDMLQWTASLYRDGRQASDPNISPLFGKVTSHLTPAHIIVAECDILRDQAIGYAEKLRDAGASVRCNYFRGVPHAFVAMAGSLETGQIALDDSIEHLRLAFSKA